jgi:hypothetical protein
LFARREGLIEIRSRAAGRWHQQFIPTGQIGRAAALAARLSLQSDVYVGVLPRRRSAGGRADLVARGHLAWADLDDPLALERLRAFSPPASLIVASGTAGHAHSYWSLRAGLAIDELERVNRALAARLNADQNACDAARVLRIAGTRSHKHTPPAAVRIQSQRAQRVRVEELLATLGELPPARPQRSRRASGGRPLDAVTPEVYVRALTGQRVGRSRKVRCPLHDDQRPSLHVYVEPERGWYCFGCRRGGTVFDLAGWLWQRPTRGAQFTALRAELERLLLS